MNKIIYNVTYYAYFGGPCTPLLHVYVYICTCSWMCVLLVQSHTQLINLQFNYGAIIMSNIVCVYAYLQLCMECHYTGATQSST